MGRRKERKRGCTVSTGASFFFRFNQGGQMKDLPIRSARITFGIIIGTGWFLIPPAVTPLNSMKQFNTWILDTTIYILDFLYRGKKFSEILGSGSHYSTLTSHLSVCYISEKVLDFEVRIIYT